MTTATQPIACTPEVQHFVAVPPVALVVEDDPDMRARIATILRGDGWSVQEARDAEAGLAAARTYRPRIVVLDLSLPRMSGLQLMRTLKSWTDHPTRVVVVSFYAMLMRKADQALADAVVQSPFSAPELTAAVAPFQAVQTVRSVRP